MYRNLGKTRQSLLTLNLLSSHSLPKLNSVKLQTKDKQAGSQNDDVAKFANADEESLEIFKEAKASQKKRTSHLKMPLLKLNI